MTVISAMWMYSHLAFGLYLPCTLLVRYAGKTAFRGSVPWKENILEVLLDAGLFELEVVGADHGRINQVEA